MNECANNWGKQVILWAQKGGAEWINEEVGLPCSTALNLMNCYFIISDNCGLHFENYQGTCLKLLTGKCSVVSSKSHCEAYGGVLAQPKTVSDMNVIRSFLTDKGHSKWYHLI